MDILDVLCMFPDEMRMELISVGGLINNDLKGRSPKRGAEVNSYLFFNKKIKCVVCKYVTMASDVSDREERQ